MNETFSLQRFWTYFKYDVTQTARRNGRTYLYFAGSGLLLYFLSVLGGLIFEGQWSTPDLTARAVLFVIMFNVLTMFQARTYGHLTERKAGSAWLMVPASRLEKFVSMLLIVLVLIPLFFVGGYLLIDGILSLVDPTVGAAVASRFTENMSSFMAGMSEIQDVSPISVTSGGIMGMALLGVFFSLLFFLLCGLCFKKNKIGGALLVIFVSTMVLSSLGALLAFPGFKSIADMPEQEAIELATRFMNGSVIVICLVAAGLGWGVWRRIKTLQH